MTWKQISEEVIWDLISLGRQQMDTRQQRLWDAIHIEPKKWSQAPYGDKAGGFWVVALIGRTVIYYNDIEDGFNRSTYSKYGIIQDYFCNQDVLARAVQIILNIMVTGHDIGGQASPPKPGSFPA